MSTSTLVAPARKAKSPKRSDVYLDKLGRSLRVIRHEHKGERVALEQLVTLYQDRVERINCLCSDKDRTGAEFRLQCSPDAQDIEFATAKPWRRGQTRHAVYLYNDRPKLFGGINSFFSGDLLAGDANPVTVVKGIRKHFRQVIASLKSHMQNLIRDVEENPSEWQPLPTLGEFMEGKE